MTVDWEARRKTARTLALESGFGERDADLIVRLARPAARLQSQPDTVPVVGASKLGGLPDVARGFEWPRGEHGWMTFCGQVSVADVVFLLGVDAWQPSEGTLSFFADKDLDADNAEAGKVLFVPPGRLQRASAPAGLTSRSRFDEAALVPLPVLSPPMAELIEADLDHDLDEDDWAAWERLHQALGCGDATSAAPHHQLFGRPWQIGTMNPLWIGAIKLSERPEPEGDDAAAYPSLGREDDEAAPYRLLAQFTTDQEANMEIADGGAFYFVISVEDLAANRYERTAVWTDTY